MKYIFWIIVAIGFTAVFMYFFNKREYGGNNTDNNKADNAVRPFVTQIDLAISEYAEYECIIRLRKETVDLLKDAYNQSPSEFMNFSNSIDHRLWAYKQLANITLQELGTGKYHIRDILKPEGHILANVNRHCLQNAYKYNYISKSELDEALKSLDNQIKEVGTWA